MNGVPCQTILPRAIQVEVSELQHFLLSKHVWEDCCAEWQTKNQHISVNVRRWRFFYHCKIISHIVFPTTSTPLVFNCLLRLASWAVAVSMIPDEARCSSKEKVTESVNSGWPCSVRIWTLGKEVGVDEATSFGRKRTIPWLGVRTVEASMLKFGGVFETWSRCIWWSVYLIGLLSTG